MFQATPQHTLFLFLDFNKWDSVKLETKINFANRWKHCSLFFWLLYTKSFPQNIYEETDQNWLVVSTHLKNISQIGNLPQIGVKIKNI